MKDNIAEQEFIPSQRLIDLVDEKMARPEGEEWAMFEEILSKIPEEEMNKRMVKIITEEVEGFFTMNAHHYSYGGNFLNTNIFDDGEFTEEARLMLIDYLGMDEAKDLTELLALLKKEIIEFLKIPRERGWGQIVLEKGLIKFNLKKDAFQTPNLEEIPDDAWITTS